MRPQVVALFKLEYGKPLEEVDEWFGRFYEHPFQKDRCTRIVALEGEKVAGFQAFFHWPVVMNGRTLNSLQSGDSIVHPQFRGKGVFSSMLSFMQAPATDGAAELLIGFPIQASYGALMRNQWRNPFNLEWHIKPLHPVRSLFATPEVQLRRALGQRKPDECACDHGLVMVRQSRDFDDYRFGFEKGELYRYEYESGGKKVLFEMKAQRRKAVIRELVIGKIVPSHADGPFLRAALADLLALVRACASFTMASCAVNSRSVVLATILAELGFHKIARSIYFTAKGPVAEQVADWSNWWIFRGDHDTW